MTWFAGVKTVGELRKKYKELLKRYHPDNSDGSVEITQEINREYDLVFGGLRHDKDAEGRTYNDDENKRFKAVLNEIIGYNMDIEVIGSWIWAFLCYPYKDRLKELGFKYAPKKKAWIWHEGAYVRFNRKEMPLSSIREKYGSQKLKKQCHQLQFTGIYQGK